MWCPEWDSNPHWIGFEPNASAGWAIGAAGPGYRAAGGRLSLHRVVALAHCAGDRPPPGAVRAPAPPEHPVAVALTPDQRDGLVARLRAAGCVFAEDEAALLAGEAADQAELGRTTTRRVAGEPLEHVLGWAEFCGRRVAVDPGVFVPRRRTELLVRLAVAVAPTVADPAAGLGADDPHTTGPRSDGPRVVDLCCGSGAVGAAVAAALPGSALWSCDLDPAAVACARRNVPPAAVVLLGDLDAPLPGSLAGRVDLLLANAPYVPTTAIALMPPEARDHEARLALDGGADGLALHRRVAAAAPRWLTPHGRLLIETSEQQADGTLAACVDAGLTGEVVHDDEVDGTVVVARRG